MLRTGAGSAITRAMLAALALSFGQLGDAAVRRTLAKTLAATLLVFALAGTGLWFALDALVDRWRTDLDGWTAAATTLVMIVALWLLFRAVAVAVMGLFADDVVIAVERRYYPDALATARSPSLGVTAQMGAASATRAVLVNLAALPLYLLLLVTGIGPAIAFALVNGWLLGRDLGEMVAVRHMDRAAIRPWLAATRGRRMLMGLVATGLFMVPLLNLVAPVVGAAMATHLFHRRLRR